MLGETYQPPIGITLPRSGAAVRRRVAETLVVVGRRLPRLAVRRSPMDLARALRGIFDDLGATYLKIGQLAGSAPGLLGQEVSDVFRGCLDAGPPVPFERIRFQVERDLGQRLEDVFPVFSKEPLAAASIAVVHRAETADGQPVAVKILRPGIEKVVAADLDFMQPLFRVMTRQGSEVGGIMLQWAAGLRMQVAEELDLRNEARTMHHFSALFAEAGLDQLVVPTVDRRRSGRRVLTMELLDGVAIDDLTAVERSGHDPAPLIEQAVKAWFLTALRHQVFHGDIHAGNLMLLRDGRLGVVDWGIVGRLDPNTYRFFRRTIEGAMGDDTAWEEMPVLFKETTGMSFLMDGAGLSKEEAGKLVKSQMLPMLTQPLGQLNLSLLFGPPTGSAPASTREKVDRRRRMRRMQRMALDKGVFEAAANLSGFLLAKQLIYLERYGKMYIPDLPLLADRQFLEALLG